MEVGYGANNMEAPYAKSNRPLDVFDSSHDHTLAYTLDNTKCDSD
jgi:hypothetical protein